MVFDTQSIQQQEMDPLPGYGFASYPYFAREQIQMPMTFGNPFVTSFDEGVPVVNMQDLWLDAVPSGGLSMEFADISIFEQQ